MKTKLLLTGVLSATLLLGACGNEDSKDKPQDKKSESVEKKKEASKKSEAKKDTDKKESEETEQTEQVATEETQSQEQQQQQQPVQQEPTDQEKAEANAKVAKQNGYTGIPNGDAHSDVPVGQQDENYANHDAEFYDSLPQYEKDKMASQLEAQESADEDDPRWDEQLEINMRDDLSDAERDQLSDEVWSN